MIYRDGYVIVSGTGLIIYYALTKEECEIKQKLLGYETQCLKIESINVYKPWEDKNNERK